MTTFIVYVPETGNAEYITTKKNEKLFIANYLIPNGIHPDECDRIIFKNECAVTITSRNRYN